MPSVIWSLKMALVLEPWSWKRTVWESLWWE